jgi:hypothetical protein
MFVPLLCGCLLSDMATGVLAEPTPCVLLAEVADCSCQVCCTPLAALMKYATGRLIFVTEDCSVVMMLLDRS